MSKTEMAPVPQEPEQLKEKTPKSQTESRSNPLTREEFEQQLQDPVLYRYLLKICEIKLLQEPDRKEVAQDLVQDVLLKASKKYDSFRGESKIKT